MLRLPEPEDEDGAEGDQEDQGEDDIPVIDPGQSSDEEDAFPEEEKAEEESRDNADGADSGSESESEEGFDSEDIDNWDGSDEGDLRESALADEQGQETDISELDETLERMMEEARGPNGKPTEDTSYNVLGINRDEAAQAFDPDRQNPDGSSKGVWKVSDITGKPKRVYPAIEPNYDSDSSTEDAPNRIGNVPLEWYDDLPHIGYDMDGKKVMRPAKGDELDRFLSTVDDPESWMSAQDKMTGQDIRLTDEELDIIRRLQNAEIPDGSYDPYEPTVEWFTGKGKELQTPMTAKPEPKRRFVPSKWEHKKVMKIVRAIRQGRIVPRAPTAERPPFYNIWSEADEPHPDHPMNMPAPKMPLPGHAESYNPPAEYLFNNEERKEFESTDPADRKINFMPAKHPSLRNVPGYQNFMQERFERCLDLYLAPRIRKKRVDIDDPESLVPKLPSPKDLRPFPSMTGVIYSHPGAGDASPLRVRCIAIDPLGVWCATGADDGRVRLWDLAIGRCAAVWDLHAASPSSERAPVQSVEWCPNKAMGILVATTAGKVTVIAPPQANVGHAPTASPSFLFATSGYQMPGTESADMAKNPVKWTRPRDVERNRGVAAHIAVPGTPKQVQWHAKGDYFATVASDAGASAVLVHQLSKHRSQAPFRKANKGSAVQKVAFHPFKPQLFVATQRYIRIYDLAAQQLMKTLLTGLKWISSLDIHPGGDNLIVGSYDKRLIWFDLELSNKPYKTLRYHSRAIRAVCFHRSYPLFASVSDDGTAQIFHGNVFSDFSQNALIVPLKVLRGHEIKNGLGLLDAKWHPTQPWLLTAGADGEGRLWTT
ncbi:BOP1NT-domain-containing protein [Tilletiaria anomala UBC 951]|uniref:Ribosome biogenesis protein ERB1 n=1 Tax=Tilletiaria anomala (strain ATCC 24038 / CBS 436.72 / UBC 951) TaxID=1037660 RepID=A0A066W4Q8_TILAU|nr:BOP1NT-domain-containing protein [Tilletiaria anomala UBC 951]KDN45755.1 BOP1NT-domain-containing protein [Tilletiaria anomala UBC 951]